MSNCRTDLHLVEIIELILAAPSGKQPGPDGVASEFFKAYSKTLAPLFQEGWQELLQGTYSDPHHLGCRKWSVIPKGANVRTTEKLRDLEMTNVVRKTLARMANRVLLRNRLFIVQETSQGIWSRFTLCFATTSTFSLMIS